MSVSAETEFELDPRVRGVLQQYWGFETLRPLQAEAIDAGINGRDCLLVMPTGGGKSLCYQLPPLVEGRLDIVISPLIALMKDQVDGLRQIGYPAAAIHSQLDPAERQAIREQVRAGELRLLFVTPERLLSERFLDFVERQGVERFTIDEAHCISQWGHDFRQEYRGLHVLKQRFANASVHACTATATPRVQQDIVDQLGLVEPQRIIGTFDRPNLVYRIIPKGDVERQTLDAVRRHDREAVIVYCLSRKDTESLAEFLRLNNVRAAAYHAGLESADRRHTQEAFAAEEIDVVVATVAFGMGIDRSNVRCIVHAAMPKSIEHYQQETGRAGRDGLEAECVMLYSGGDAMRWEGLIEKSASEAGQPEAAEAQIELLRHLRNMCGTYQCRHRALTRYFGQSYPHDNCGACDVCLGEVESMSESTTVAQKILSCVYRLGQRFGAGYVKDVLRGADTQQVRQRGHAELSTYGLMRNWPEKSVLNLIYQLIDQGLLVRAGDELPVLALGDDAMSVLRDELSVHFIDPAGGTIHETGRGAREWEDVHTGLFERLRALRKAIAQERSVPTYVIFNDNTLRELARRRPSSLKQMSGVSGVGSKKLDDLGKRFVDAITAYCRENNLDTDAGAIVRPAKRRAAPVQKTQAMKMFSGGAGIDDVAAATNRARSTVSGYLVEYIEQSKPADVSPWVPDAVYERVMSIAGPTAADRLKPVYEALDGQVPYETIRIVLAHQAAMAEQ